MEHWGIPIAPLECDVAREERREARRMAKQSQKQESIEELRQKNSQLERELAQAKKELREVKGSSHGRWGDDPDSGSFKNCLKEW